MTKETVMSPRAVSKRIELSKNGTIPNLEFSETSVEEQTSRRVDDDEDEDEEAEAGERQTDQGPPSLVLFEKFSPFHSLRTFLFKISLLSISADEESPFKSPNQSKLLRRSLRKSTTLNNDDGSRDDISNVTPVDDVDQTMEASNPEEEVS